MVAKHVVVPRDDKGRNPRAPQGIYATISSRGPRSQHRVMVTRGGKHLFWGRSARSGGAAQNKQHTAPGPVAGDRLVQDGQAALGLEVSARYRRAAEACRDCRMQPT